jgi:general secretion pathway protein N
MRAPKISRLAVAAAAITFLVTLIAAFPARVAIGWFAPSGLAVSGVEGSLWKGRIGGLRAANLRIGAASWRIRPLAMLTGRISADVEAAVPGGFVSGRVAAGLTGTVDVRDARAGIPLAELTGGTSIGRAAGELRAAIDRARLIDGWPESITGEVQLMGVRYRVPQLGDTALGSYVVTFADTAGGAEAGTPEGIIRSTSGPFEVDGMLRLLPARGYSLTAQVRATSSAPAALRNALQFLGSPDERGFYPFRAEGTL